MPRTGGSSAPTTAWSAAISLLARRDLSEGEVRSKLLARNFAEPEVDEAVARLRERRYLDDHSLAAAVVRTQARSKHQGPLKVRAHLSRRQIPEELAQEAIRAEFSDGAETERALLALRRLERSGSAPAPPGGSSGQDPDERKKAAARLLRRLVARGYSWEAARAAVLDARLLPGPDDPERPQ